MKLNEVNKKILKLYIANLINGGIYYAISSCIFSLTNRFFIAFLIPSIITGITGYYFSKFILTGGKVNGTK